MKEPTYGNNITLPTYRENHKKLLSEYRREVKIHFRERTNDSDEYYYAFEKCKEYYNGRLKTVKDFAEFFLKLAKSDCKISNLPFPEVHFEDDMTIEDVRRHVNQLYCKVKNIS